MLVSFAVRLEEPSIRAALAFCNALEALALPTVPIVTMESWVIDRFRVR